MNRQAKGLNLGLGLGCSAAFAPCPVCSPCLHSPALLPRDPAIHHPMAIPHSPPSLPVLVGRCRQRNVSPPRQSCPDPLEPSQLGGRGDGVWCWRLPVSSRTRAWLHPVWALQRSLAGSCNPARTESLLLLCLLFQNSSSGEFQGIFTTKCRHWLIQAPESFVASEC